MQTFVQSKPNTGFRPGFSGICLKPPRMGIPQFALAPIPLLIYSHGEFYFLISHQILLEQPRLRHQFPQPFSQPWFCKTSQGLIRNNEFLMCFLFNSILIYKNADNISMEINFTLSLPWQVELQVSAM